MFGEDVAYIGCISGRSRTDTGCCTRCTIRYRIASSKAISIIGLSILSIDSTQCLAIDIVLAIYFYMTV